VIVALTGASGFIGRALAGRLTAAGHEVRPLKLREEQSVPACDAVVHLAGESVAQRWTTEAKRRILASRTDGTRRLIAELEKLPAPPRVLVCASAIGFYGSRGDEILDEKSAPGDGFLARVCVQLERAADPAAALGIRVVKLRIGVVLGPGGGALARMIPAFRLGVAGRLGSGRQWMSWIHLADLLALIEFALANGIISGPVNATAPNPVTNAQFTAGLARALKRPAFVPAPAFALKLMFGEMASMLLEGQRVLPRAALEAGFSSSYPELGPALRSLLP
jgi:uncharacterized protein (TIGR01777 family)